jgi:hypothetical protein
MPWWLAHLIGDYIIQTDWVAARKRTSTPVCLLHAATYLLPFLLCPFAWWQLAAIGIEHFFQDRFGWARTFMRYSDHEHFATGPLSPWSVVVTDNILHLCWIAAIAACHPKLPEVLCFLFNV